MRKSRSSAANAAVREIIIADDIRRFVSINPKLKEFLGFLEPVPSPGSKFLVFFLENNWLAPRIERGEWESH